MNIIMLDTNKDYCVNLGKYLKSNAGLDVIKILDNDKDALSYIQDHKNILDLVMVDLEKFEPNINEYLDILPKGCNLIAFSESLETVNRYVNYPYFQRVFQKPMAFSAILNYISLQNGIETFERMKKQVLNTLSLIGFNINHAGTVYLADGVALSQKNNLKKLSDIYILVAHAHSTDPKLVGWSINNAINKAIKTCPSEKLQDFFKINDKQKLTAKYIINYFLNYSFE